MSNNTTLKTNIPEVATKNLMLQSFGDNKRKLVVSTNWLPLFGFEKDCFTKEELIGKNKGIRITLVNKDEVNAKKVYVRTYKSRRNNPLETMLDIRKQSLLDEAFPKECKRVHIVFKYGEILITPVTDKNKKLLINLKKLKINFQLSLHVVLVLMG